MLSVFEIFVRTRGFDGMKVLPANVNNVRMLQNGLPGEAARAQRLPDLMTGCLLLSAAIRPGRCHVVEVVLTHPAVDPAVRDEGGGGRAAARVPRLRINDVNNEGKAVLDWVTATRAAHAFEAVAL
jgi:hypothetical protein